MLKPTFRMDIASRKTYLKSELWRFVVRDNRVKFDLNHVLPGRGCYLKKDLASLELAVNTKLFTRHLHASIDEEEIKKVKESL